MRTARQDHRASDLLSNYCFYWCRHDKKKKNEQTCRDDDATRQGLLAGLCNNNGGDPQ